MDWKVRAWAETCDSMPDKQQSKHVSVRILTYQDRNQQGHRTGGGLLERQRSPRQVATDLGTGEVPSWRRKGQRQLHFNHTGSSRRGGKGEAGWLSPIPLKISYPPLSPISHGGGDGVGVGQEASTPAPQNTKDPWTGSKSNSEWRSTQRREFTEVECQCGDPKTST